jgi:acyl dehydratase
MMGLFMDEVELHKRFALGSYTFTHDNMVAYAQKFDPVGFHVDENAGKASPFGAMTAAGLHTASAWMVCYVATNVRERATLESQGKTLPEVGPSPGFKNMRWQKPVFAGDVISYFTTATAKRALKSRAGWAMLNGFNEGVNQHGETVFTFESAVLNAMRG